MFNSQTIGVEWRAPLGPLDEIAIADRFAEAPPADCR
jgi:hypothetical protein